MHEDLRRYFAADVDSFSIEYSRILMGKISEEKGNRRMRRSSIGFDQIDTIAVKIGEDGDLSVGPLCG